MDLRELAEQLIITVEGFPTEKNILGVMQVFEGIKTGCANIWEDHLMKNLNDVLLLSKTECPRCGKKLQISRTRSAVLVKPC